jgi:hypothetical protein
MQALSGAAEVELFGDGDEIADLAQVEIRDGADSRKVSQAPEWVLDIGGTGAQDLPSHKRGLRRPDGTGIDYRFE